MKANFSIICILCMLVGLTSCSDPNEFFQTAVLNTNVLSDFSPSVFGRQLEQYTVEYPDNPSTKKKGNEAQLIVKDKIAYIDKVLKDIKALSANGEESKEIKNLSIQLFESALPAYQNEYSAYAKLCDAKAPEEEKKALLEKIDKKYTSRVGELYEQLMAKGKVFAKKHQLNVNWHQ